MEEKGGRRKERKERAREDERGRREMRMVGREERETEGKEKGKKKERKKQEGRGKERAEGKDEQRGKGGGEERELPERGGTGEREEEGQTYEFSWLVLPSVDDTLKGLSQCVVELDVLLKGLGYDVVHFSLQFQQLLYHDPISLNITYRGSPRPLFGGRRDERKITTTVSTLESKLTFT